MKLLQYLGLVFVLISAAFSASAQSDYRVRTGDTLTVEVLEDSSLNRSAIVLPNGQFSFPFAGTLQGAGRTIAQIEASIRGAIAGNFTVAPTVFVAVTPREPRPDLFPPAEEEEPTIRIYFVGEFTSPGLQELTPGTTFLQAIAASGGFTDFAATKRIQLRRTNRSGLQSVYEINYRALSDGAVMQNDFALHEGDVILAPERRLFE